jgi:EAL domain-containing protein (putative c-di-GMP-specific phosphodiesterase class I)
MLAVSAVGALLLGYLLHVMVGVLGADRLRFLPLVFVGAAGVSIVRGLAPGLESGLGWAGASPNAAALISMLQGAALPAFALLALRPHLRRWRPLAPVLLGGLWIGLTAVLVANAVAGEQVSPTVVAADGRITGLARIFQVVLAVFSAVVAAKWLRRGGRQALTPEAWLGACLVFNAAGWVALLAAPRTSSTWWTVSVALGAARFVVPAIGQLVGLTSLVRTMERYERQLERRLAQVMRTQAGVPTGSWHQRGPGTTDPAAAERRTRDLLKPGALTSVFQPIFHLSSGHVVGVEALARDASDLSADAQAMFVDAYQAGLGADLEFAALRTALGALDEVGDGRYLAVNLSPRLLADPRFTDLLTNVDLTQVVLEVTEREVIEDFDVLRSTLEPLRQRGLRLAVDDTGAGYAGLRHLVGIRPEIIKLDGDLCRQIDQDSLRGALAGALVIFAEKVGATLIAEGVETEAEMTALTDVGLEHVQGFLLRRPGPLPDALLDLTPAAEAPRRSEQQ